MSPHPLPIRCPSGPDPVPIAFAHAGRVPPGSPSDAHQVSTWRRLSRAASDIL